MTKRNSYELAHMAMFIAENKYDYAVEILELKLAQLEERPEKNAEDVLRYSGALKMLKNFRVHFEGVKAGLA